MLFTVSLQMMQLATQAGAMPFDLIEVMGGGVMEWRRDRDRHLHIHSGFITGAAGVGKPATSTELLKLASVLTKQSLQINFKVTIEGVSQ